MERVVDPLIAHPCVLTFAAPELHHYTISVYHGVIMPLNIKNAEVERLATEVSRLTGESKTEAIRRALEERRRRLKGRRAADRRERVLRILQTTVWPSI